jgi:hypothetical protein
MEPLYELLGATLTLFMIGDSVRTIKSWR